MLTFKFSQKTLTTASSLR